MLPHHLGVDTASPTRHNCLFMLMCRLSGELVLKTALYEGHFCLPCLSFRTGYPNLSLETFRLNQPKQADLESSRSIRKSTLSNICIETLLVSRSI